MNKLKRLLCFTAGFAAVSLAITLGTETHAIAQAVRAALVRNQDEPGRNPYFETKDVICTAQGCVAYFSPVPAGQRLVLTFISTQCCQYGTPPQSVGLVDLGKHQQTFATQVFDAIDSGISSPVVAYFEAGETPIVIAAGIGGNLEASLSGYFISLP
jgi:hypothetical protein